MVDLHVHTLLSDGEVLPAELIRYALNKKLQGIAFTDHVDFSNLESIAARTLNVVSNLRVHYPDFKLLAGVELTHIPPPAIKECVNIARDLGIQLVIVHGETLAEPVAKSTNLAAIEANVDILAHPGLIKEEEVKLAAERGVYLELTGRAIHAFSNGIVAKLANKFKAKLVFCSDAHRGEDILSEEEAYRICLGAGVNENEIKILFNNAYSIICSKI